MDAKLQVPSNQVPYAFNIWENKSYEEQNYIIRLSKQGCSQTVTINIHQKAPYQCISAPAHATLIPGDDWALTENTTGTLVRANTPAMCEYMCNDGYVLSKRSQGRKQVFVCEQASKNDEIIPPKPSIPYRKAKCGGKPYTCENGSLLSLPDLDDGKYLWMCRVKRSIVNCSHPKS